MTDLVCEKPNILLPYPLVRCVLAGDHPRVVKTRQCDEICDEPRLWRKRESIASRSRSRAVAKEHNQGARPKQISVPTCRTNLKRSRVFSPLSICLLTFRADNDQRQ